MKIGRFALWFFHPLAQLLFPFKAYGKENIPPESADDRTILCCNHISDIDPMYLEMCQRRHIYFMAKAELFRSPFLRWFFGKQLGAFPVERGKGDTKAIDTAFSLVNEGKLLGIFPEGTRSRDGKLGRAKSGAALIAAQTGARILPVSITTREQKVKLFRQTRIRFGVPITPEELHLQDAEHPDLRYASRLIMDRIHELMKEDPLYAEPVEEKEGKRSID